MGVGAPEDRMVYLTLTNNTSSTKVISAPNPRKPNPWGHIIRWRERGGDHASTAFDWDLFLLAGQGRSSGDGSTIADEDAFGSSLVRPGRSRSGSRPTARSRSAQTTRCGGHPYVTDGQGAPEIKGLHRM